MKKPSSFNLRTGSPIFLILGLLFFVIGLISNQNIFTWIAIGFLLISLVAGGKWIRKK
jgi:uncharacterized membrane protein YdbT with pleckstrin-like domain